jgi:hypothetical protein
VRMNRLNPIHNHFAPPIASMKDAKIASGLCSGKPPQQLQPLATLTYNPQFLKGNN